MSDELEELKQRVQRTEERMTSADSAIQQLQCQSQRVPRAVRAVVGLCVLAAAVALLASPPPEKTVRAPFRVVDGNNKIIFMVTEDHGFSVYRAGNQQTPALLGVADKGDGKFQQNVEFRAQSEDENTVAVFGVSHGDTPVLGLRYGGTARTLHMSVISGKPVMTVSNDKWAVVDLGQGERGAGRFRVANKTGSSWKVQAGTTGSAVGAVAALSDAPPGGGFLGVPGSFICGTGCSGK
ncbi:MAG TPA: hypothetical protein VGQ12_12740 [Candidatus Angelobacter sp.]|jgi:hypothetical protein|nr:hypothetical protein [Candidatus Angelobacter sp.]